MRTINKYIQEIIGVLPAVAAAGGAYWLWNRFMSDAAKSCNRYAGAAKTVCMLKYKIRTAKIMISKARSEKEKLLWKSREQQYLYKLKIAQEKLQTQQQMKQ